jgi:hypothetical protein
MCPVSSLKKYCALVKDLKFLFPAVLKNKNQFSNKVAVGKNTLGNFMCSLYPKKLELSQQYTNHCIRVTGENFAMLKSAYFYSRICTTLCMV